MPSIEKKIPKTEQHSDFRDFLQKVSDLPQTMKVAVSIGCYKLFTFIQGKDSFWSLIGL